MAPCYLLVPGTTTQTQARVFCSSLGTNPNAGSLGWPDSMQDMAMINSNYLKERGCKGMLADKECAEISYIQRRVEQRAVAVALL
uniref:Uncharacterized protein n=1 Tax=Parascaris univalens TaxID=6257 RepID=A0A915CH23_PARUN